MTNRNKTVTYTGVTNDLKRNSKTKCFPSHQKIAIRTRG